MANQTSDAGRPRFYELGYFSRIEPTYEFVNKDRAFINRNRSGSHWVELPGTEFRYKVGIPTFAERPRFVLDAATKRGNPFDFYDFDGFLLISSRFKALIDAIDPHAIESAECDAHDSRGEPLPPYWWIDVVRVLDLVVDEQRSALRYMTESAFASGDEIDKLLYIDLQDVVFRPNVVGDSFSVSCATGPRPIIGQQLADAIRAAGWTGVFLTSLQPPLPNEAKDHLAFKNYPYWTNEGYGQ